MSFVGTSRVGGVGGVARDSPLQCRAGGKGQSLISGKCPDNHFQAGSNDTACRV
jgi:hypothetical protein